MTLARLALTLAVGGLAANLFMKSRRSAYALKTEPAVDGLAWREAPQSGQEAPTATKDEGLVTDLHDGSAAAGGDSPNGAERLEAAGLAQTPAGGPGSDLLTPAPTAGVVDGIKPGLSDFARGA